jgi:hypothetical protein
LDALKILKDMHVEAKAAFDKIEAAPPAKRGALWAKLHPELELHERIEERFVYDPVGREAGATDPVLARWEEEHEAQVRDADALMARIGKLDPADAGWLKDVTALAATLAKHIKHEEDDIWPRIRRAWGEDKLAHAGRQIAAARAAAKAGSSVSQAVAKGAKAPKGTTAAKAGKAAKAGTSAGSAKAAASAKSSKSAKSAKSGKATTAAR